MRKKFNDFYNKTIDGIGETKIVAAVKKQIQLSKESKIHKANLIIVLCSLAVTVLFIILGYIWLGISWTGWDGDIGTNGLVVQSGDDTAITVKGWLLIVLIPGCSIAAYAGIVAVIAQNNKSPIKFFIFSSMTIAYRIGFVLAQFATQPDEGGGVNATLLLGQPAFFIMLIGQMILWTKWNNEGEGGKFQSEALRGKRAVMAFIIIGIIVIFMALFSIFVNDEEATFVAIFMDVTGSTFYMMGAILNAFGNILCFPLYFISNLSWFYWGIKGIVENKDPLMTLFALTTMLQAIGLNALLVTGFVQWFKDDFEWVKGKGIRAKDKSNTTEQEVEIKEA